MKRKIIFLGGLLLCSAALCAQTNNVENRYRMPLKEVFDSIEHRFQVRLRYPAELVKDRDITYAMYRFEPDLETTLRNVTAYYDLSFVPQPDGSYKIKEYEYARKQPADGQKRLEYLSTVYDDLGEWESRKKELRRCMYETLGVAPLREKMTLRMVATTPVRKMQGYTVQNFALETIPGMYVTGSVYRPTGKAARGKVPLILNPNGHSGQGRYRKDMQARCATFARMGAIAVNFDLFAWGESQLQFGGRGDHNKSVALTMQTLDALALLDYFTQEKDVDVTRIGITGGSGGGTQTMLMTALDDRIAASAPVVSVSSYFHGGCPCESGLPIHLCGRGTNNAEIAAMAAPRPMLLVSDGKDWTANIPDIEFPFIKRTYGFYGKEGDVYNAHFPTEGHDYAYSKRQPVYEFMARYLGLDLEAVRGSDGKVDESGIVFEDEPAFYVFGEKGEKLPSDAVKGLDALYRRIAELGGK